MNTRDRRVRQLRFVCQREEHARRGQTLLDDALRTASLEDEGRVVVIRSLALGRISPHATAMEWSRRVEQRVCAVKKAAVFAETPEAAAAEAVWFPNTIELWVALAVRAARGVPCTEWFWLPAAAGWSPRLGAAATLRLAFRQLVATGGWPATFALARRLACENRLLPLLRALSPEDVGPWLTAESHSKPAPGSSTRPSEHAPGRPPWPEPRWPGGWEAVAEHVLTESPVGDSRLVWLAAAALSGTSSVPPPIREAQRLVERTARDSSGQPAHTEGPATVVHGPGPEFTASPSADEPGLEQRPPVLLEQPRHPEGALTACGGLFFLIGLFERLGIAAWPDPAAAAWEALSLVLQRCRASRHDELSKMLPAIPDCAPTPFVLAFWPQVESPHGPRQVVRWRADWRVLLDASGRLPLAAWRRGGRAEAIAIPDQRRLRRAPAFQNSLQPRALALALGAHRLARRMTGLGLKTLVRRPARVTVTDTHVDLFFRLAETDVRVRRAALDVDPGWVPWLGRIVSFHYTRED